ncbi:GNAT domain-containing protein [Aspergillus granulosus]|uniref:GNAT domain-containing protein n=1 Tax=Aspergillus granulosus TaxID=176169 RepID=A0ABR4GZG8_9EURO
MLLNATTAISTSKVLLVPYSKWHVPRYHEWMKDEEIQEATASEPLSLNEEYAMQQSWRNDADKLTFIVCLPTPKDVNANETLTEEDDSPACMIGDINLFLQIDDGDEGTSALQIIGEIELMIAEKKDQRRGFGKAALLTFLRYVVAHEGAILGEFVSRDEAAKRGFGTAGREGEGRGVKLEALSVKIGQKNERSLALFEGVGFGKVAEEPNYFGEWELRRTGLDLKAVEGELEGAGVEGYVEVEYGRRE